MPKLIRRKVKTPITLRSFYVTRNQILIYRNIGGLGDLLMHRMVFEDFKAINPNMKIIFACLSTYFDAVKDHPFIDEVVDGSKIDINQYAMSYNTSNACCRHEMSVSPLADKNRSDIWANHCGVQLKNHNMHISLTSKELEFGKEKLKSVKKDNFGPNVLFCPISAMRSKNLLPEQIAGVVQELRKLGCFVYSSHTKPIKEFEDLDVPVITGLWIRDWMSVVMSADYVISVDTAAFHFAGGMNKPVVGIFTWACGYTYGQYYPTKTIVQFHRNTHPEWTCGPCYDWSNCPFEQKKPQKPCLTKITVEMIMDGVRKMMAKYPI